VVGERIWENLLTFTQVQAPIASINNLHEELKPAQISTGSNCGVYIPEKHHKSGRKQFLVMNESLQTNFLIFLVKVYGKNNKNIRLNIYEKK
jgi:hypothetical protein